jgi:hypothetical protein
MQIEVSAKDPAASALLPVATDRLRFALRRLAWWLQHVQVRMEDENGPRSGHDKRCRVLLKTRQGHAVLMTEVADDWRVAFERALARAVRKLGQLHDRVTKAPRARRLTALRTGDLVALPGRSMSLV